MKQEQSPSRVLEAYTGEYASGKSENAVNRAVELARQGRRVTLVDLDLVEPCYTLRPLKKI
jgi:Mrp family chromosome partitioning ATPase